LKELPTYELLYKCDINRINEELYPRCEKLNEDWEHIWICEANEMKVSTLVKNAVYEYENNLMNNQENERSRI
jgi:hypothetical protein